MAFEGCGNSAMSEGKVDEMRCPPSVDFGGETTRASCWHTDGTSGFDPRRIHFYTKNDNPAIVIIFNKRADE